MLKTSKLYMMTALIAACVGATQASAAPPVEKPENADPAGMEHALSPSEQTSSEQAALCQSGLDNCNDQAVTFCVQALKTCVGDQRTHAMKMMEGL